MSKGILQFSLPEERHEFETAVHAYTFATFIDNFGNWLRRKYKHEDPESDDRYKEWEEIYDHWCEEIGDLPEIL